MFTQERKAIGVHFPGSPGPHGLESVPWDLSTALGQPTAQSCCISLTLLCFSYSAFQSSEPYPSLLGSETRAECPGGDRPGPSLVLPEFRVCWGVSLMPGRGGRGTHSQGHQSRPRGLAGPIGTRSRTQQDGISQQNVRHCPWIPKSSQKSQRGREGGEERGGGPGRAGNQRAGAGKGEPGRWVSRGEGAGPAAQFKEKA